MEQRKLDNSPLTYYVSGTDHDQWILFIHAAFVNHSMFRTQFDYFKQNYNILAIDIIGHGKSLDTQEGDSVEKMSQWIFEILATEKIDQIHIVGVSLGAVLAQDFSNNYPHAVRSLSCIGSYDINNFDGKLDKENNVNQMLMMLKTIFSVKWFAESNKKISAYTPQAQEEFYQMNSQFQKKSFRYLSALKNLENKHTTQKRGYPLLVGYGEHDLPAVLTLVDQWKLREPESTFMKFEDAGHCVNMDVPQEFNRVLEDFFSTVE